MNSILKGAVTTVLTLASSGQAIISQVGNCSVDAMLVFDGSASMAEITFETGPNTRIVEARKTVRYAMPNITKFRRVGLLTYGAGPLGACENLITKFPPIEDAADPIVNSIDTLEPGGLTPLTQAVRRAAEALKYQIRPGVVVLVIDGNETCGGRHCEMAQALIAMAHDLTIHVIGFRAELDFFAWNSPEQNSDTAITVARCLSDKTGGTFVTTESVDELVFALQRTLGCPLFG